MRIRMRRMYILSLRMKPVRARGGQGRWLVAPRATAASPYTASARYGVAGAGGVAVAAGLWVVVASMAVARDYFRWLIKWLAICRIRWLRVLPPMILWLRLVYHISAKSLSA